MKNRGKIVFCLLLVLGLAVLTAGCAAGDEAIRVTPETQTRVAAAVSGEPIYSTSIAIYLAELALRDKGVTYENRNMSVSFCDNVYTVVFEKDSADVQGCDYTIKINANNSKIISVVTMR
jgi:hypothetical protein